MSRVVFDIETVGFGWDTFDQKQQEFLTKIAKDETDLEVIKSKLALHPLTGRVVTIALYNPDTKKGVVYFDSGNSEKYDHVIDNITYKSMDEEGILTNFWKDIEKFDEFITFNGSSFDCPFLIMRSAILCIKCSRDIVPPRFEKKPHIDLMKVLTFYGEFGSRYNLDFYCKAFGVKSPKAGEVHGDEVPKFFSQGEGLKIAEYCMGDVIATAELLKKWEDCAPPPFKKVWN